MQSNTKAPETIDEYIAGFPADIQVILQKIRKTIKDAAPDAQEAISYQMPTFKFHGNLVHFAAFKNHIGFYPVPPGSRNSRQNFRFTSRARARCSSPWINPFPMTLSAGS